MKKWIIAIIIIVVLYPLTLLGYFLYGDRWGLSSTLAKVPVLNSDNKYDKSDYVKFDRNSGAIISNYNREFDVEQTSNLYKEYFDRNDWKFISTNQTDDSTIISYLKRFNNKSYSLVITMYDNSLKTNVVIKTLTSE